MLLPCVLLLLSQLCAQNFITEKKENSGFVLVGSNAATLVVDDKDHWLVQKAASFLQTDIESVTGKKPAIQNILSSGGKNIILIGSADRSSLIAQLVKNKKIKTGNLLGKWEAYQIQVVANPFPGIDNALVITGSDRRGTAFGVFELSRQMGVSPWNWWADVPVKKKKEIYITKGTNITDQPSVKYRGIFINDEAPAFSGWTKEKFGGVNHLVYEKIFELLLRLKSNYLWPAMWGNAFADDDTLNPILADKYGIVISNSHHEPMLRAQQEWKRYGKGAWNYQTNDTVLRAFWKKGIENMGTHESVVSIGMRGDGDMPMTQGSNIALLERIVADQRKIIEEVTGKPASEIPQSWALYKEVQDYYDKGMRVPDDVTLLLCDDNWGNIRKLPKLTDAPRKGGYGIYYHFDYVGGPRNYKWLNTNPIPRVWEQMHLAYEYGVKNIWVVNVGDIKPMEFPISFFLDYAWAPDRIKATDLKKYTEKWAADQFGSKYAVEIADILSKYAKYNGRRKPELLDANTYSFQNYHEAKNVTEDYNKLLLRAEKINEALQPEYKDAYFQLVLHPVKACANLQELYLYVARNKWQAGAETPMTNTYANKVKELYIKDSLISLEYNALANGKWNHMMDQTHIGYTYWQQPNKQKIPDVKYVPDRGDSSVISEPIFMAQKTAINLLPKTVNQNFFYEQDGYISIEGDHYSKAINGNNISWQVLPDHGKTGSAITTMPVTAATQIPGNNSPHLEYEIYVYDTGIVKLQAYLSPTLNFHNDEGLKYAVSVDDETPQTVVINKDDNNTRIWEGWMTNNIIIKTTIHAIPIKGRHVIKFWMVSPAVILQKLVGDMGGVKPSYLGPPETRFTQNTIKQIANGLIK
ncbi:MAG: glycosyhydrolase [Sediminibacterium sp.]|nr:glycosyhydrolase [Sediminibacterium sp.]